MATQARIIADFERGKITFKQMSRQLKKAAVRRNRKADKRRKRDNWK